jgi:hypothetical protein
MRDYDELVSDLRKMQYTEYCAIASATDFLAIRIVQDAADAIEELLAAVPHWISVEERLPDRYETVLLNIQTVKDCYVTIGDYEPNELRFRDFTDRNNHVYCGDIVTHWMPLPDPPKEGARCLTF